MKRLWLIPALTVSLLACGGSDVSSLQAAKLTYTDPTSTGYRLVKGSGSTDTHLVLALLGPDGEKVRGVALAITAAPPLQFAKVKDGDPELVENGGFELGSGTPILHAGVANGALKAGVFQKATTASALTASASTPLLELALEARGGGDVGLTVGRAIALPDTGDALPIRIAVGTLRVTP